jgi:hypothetical protein
MKTEKLWTFAGDLYREDKGHKVPLRRDYDKCFGTIKTTTQFKSTLRHGPYAWPGGYPLFFITSDCAALCFACARKEARNILDSIKHRLLDGWRIIACDINYENNDLYCDHCSKPIESAYGDNETSKGANEP